MSSSSLFMERRSSARILLCCLLLCTGESCAETNIAAACIEVDGGTSYHPVASSILETLNCSVLEAENDVAWSDQWSEITLDSRQQFLLRWFSERIFIGLRLFWHSRGKGKCLIVGVCLGLWSLLYNCGTSHSGGCIPALTRFALGSWCVACTILASFASCIGHALLCTLLFDSWRLSVLSACSQGFPVKAPSLGPIPRARLYALSSLVFALSLSALIGGSLGLAWNSLGQGYCSCTSLRGSFDTQPLLLHVTLANSWRCMDFDATLGFPGEGPCSLCGDPPHNIRTCPMVPDDVADNGPSAASSSIPQNIVRNTFIDFEIPAADRVRSLRGHSSDGDASLPASQLRRINKDGDAVPGSQRSEDASAIAPSLDNDLMSRTANFFARW